jgi:alpha-D-xyloside xylohydrolase
MIYSVAALTFLATSVAAGDSCVAGDAQKIDCGYAGIDHSACDSKGCCWSPAGENSTVPWCFYKVADDDAVCPSSDSQKLDCGYAGIDQNGCESKNCCWSPAGTNSQAPWCFFKTSPPPTYSLRSITPTSTGFEGILSLNGTGTATYGPDIVDLSLQVIYESPEYIRIKITDVGKTRWEIPQEVISRPSVTTKASNEDYTFTYTESPFSFQVLRKSDGYAVFKSGSFVFKDQYIELGSVFDSSAKTFGLGESARLTQALTPGSTYTFWARDEPALVKNTNLYGSFPFYMQVVDGKAHGAMILNSNGMDVAMESSCMTFKIIGGMVDLYVFSGSSPAAVAKQYTDVVGKPAMMPYWSFGFHNCKYGYKSVYEVEDVVANYAASSIPLDTQWMDIDYMEAYKDFTTDPVNFPQAEMTRFVDELHANGQHFIPIVDPGIMVQSGYDAYEQGVKQDVFVKDLNGKNYLAQVWPGPVYFPDFLNPATQSYWTTQLSDFHSKVAYDGLWIDMNEASNFCNSDGKGQVCENTKSGGCPAAGASQTDCCLVCSTPQPSNSLDFPPYNIHSNGGLIGYKTIPASGVHYGGVTEYNAHNLYGLTEAVMTNEALRDIRGKRSFSLTRSSFPSSGAHTAKWTGDNMASWDDLKSSIISIMDFSLFGVPMVGADICGFIDDTTEELCARWIEVGAFYPFSRNHNALGQKPQELYLWSTVAEASRRYLGMRYQLLPYMYSLFYNAHTSGSLVARALWVNYPNDSAALGIDRQFMLGDYLMISPVLDMGATSVTAYFPEGTWYSFADRTLTVNSPAGGTKLTLSTPLTYTNVHVRGGGILPLQRSAMTTTQGRQTPFTLLVALCPGGQAYGNLFWDDGEQIDLSSILTVSYSAKASTSSGTITASVGVSTYADAAALSVESIVVMNTKASIPASAAINDVPIAKENIITNGGTITFNLGSTIKITDNFVLVWN